ncbi:uncharacterized protein LOC126905086 isoform X2 [Daktulosphaira vitifoliae]|uniref:uncharacterized protein LOC126905086 isoform X2 n=1 Tax=Daktulosphaira vitifoliae TaxID=58002 RepID=UPI0021A9E2E1|nr:uncharacterized protein LOC126905086 isoform X2 [Daktulosphaira vitifoliae]
MSITSVPLCIQSIFLLLVKGLRNNKNINIIKKFSVDYLSTLDGVWTGHTEVLEANHRFRPLGLLSRNDLCIQFNFKFNSPITYIEADKSLTKPDKDKQKILFPDGNEFYRAVSLFLSGTENNHEYLRAIVYEEILNNVGISTFMGGQNKLQEYLQKNPVQNNGVPVTYMEVMITSYLMDTSIYFYRNQLQTWLFIPKNWNNPYIENFEENYFMYFSIQGLDTFLINDVIVV